MAGYGRGDHPRRRMASRPHTPRREREPMRLPQTLRRSRASSPSSSPAGSSSAGGTRTARHLGWIDASRWAEPEVAGPRADRTLTRSHEATPSKRVRLDSNKGGCRAPGSLGALERWPTCWPPLLVAGLGPVGRNAPDVERGQGRDTAAARTSSASTRLPWGSYFVGRTILAHCGSASAEYGILHLIRSQFL